MAHKCKDLDPRYYTKWLPDNIQSSFQNVFCASPEQGSCTGSMIKLDNTPTILYVVCGYYTNRKLHVPGESDNSICPDHKVGVVYAEDNITGNRIMCFRTSLDIFIGAQSNPVLAFTVHGLISVWVCLFVCFGFFFCFFSATPAC